RRGRATGESRRKLIVRQNLDCECHKPDYLLHMKARTKASSACVASSSYFLLLKSEFTPWTKTPEGVSLLKYWTEPHRLFWNGAWSVGADSATLSRTIRLRAPATFMGMPI